MALIKRIERSGKRRLMRLLARLAPARPVPAEDVRELEFDRILVIRQHNQMGDMLLATPALRALKTRFPDARLGIITSTLNRGVLVNNPHVDDLFTYDKRNPLSHLALIRRVRRQRYDLVVVLHTVSYSFTSTASTTLVNE